jgi:hypothetical protein
MNNPMSRKLFQTREAREKLRGMGGILASSPELSQTVARFRDGMMVNATPFDQIAQLVPNMSQQEMVAAGMPSLGLPRREIVELFERVDPNIGPEEFAAMTRQERIAAGFSSLGALNEAYFAARARLLESQFPEQGPSMPPPVPTTSLSPENFINPADEFAGVMRRIRTSCPRWSMIRVQTHRHLRPPTARRVLIFFRLSPFARLRRHLRQPKPLRLRRHLRPHLVKLSTRTRKKFSIQSSRSSWLTTSV